MYSIADITPGTLPDLVEEAGEVRILDITLAHQLGYERPRDIRNLIKRHTEELEALGRFASIRANPGPRGGRPATAFYLNRDQSLMLTVLSDTKLAGVERIRVIQVFSEYERRNLKAVYADTADRLVSYDAQREERIRQYREEKEARADALRFISQGRKRSKRRR